MKGHWCYNEACIKLRCAVKQMMLKQMLTKLSHSLNQKLHYSTRWLTDGLLISS